MCVYVCVCVYTHYVHIHTNTHTRVLQSEQTNYLTKFLLMALSLVTMDCDVCTHADASTPSTQDGREALSTVLQ